MKSLLFALAAVAALSGCQTTPDYVRIGPGPNLQVAEAQCSIMSASTQQGMWAMGSPGYVLGAELGNAIANEARRVEFMKHCMIIQGWQQVPKGQGVSTTNLSKPQKGPGAFPAAPRRL